VRKICAKPLSSSQPVLLLLSDAKVQRSAVRNVSELVGIATTYMRHPWLCVLVWHRNSKKQIQIQVAHDGDDRVHDDDDGHGSVKIMNIVCHLQLFTKRGVSDCW